MVFKPISRLHWQCKDVKGVTIEIGVAEQGVWFTAVNDKTSQMFEAKTFEHPIEAMNYASTVKLPEEKANESQAKETEAVL